MARVFYTERDIEDMHRGGVMSLEVGDSAVLTELAYEKARAVGMELLREVPDNPPCAPVRPYLSQKGAKAPAVAAPAMTHGAVAAVPATGAGPGKEDLHQRIRDAVVARLGAQADSGLVDVIIGRVLNSTGLKESGCCSAGSGAPPCAPSNTAAPRG